jgi:hypothetical protein
LIVALTLFIGIGEMLEKFNRHVVSVTDTFNTLMIITFIFWGLGLLGLILAIWKEGLGGIVSFVSFNVFIFLIGINPKPDVTFSFVLLIFLIPSVLYLYSWWLTNKLN